MTSFFLKAAVICHDVYLFSLTEDYLRTFRPLDNSIASLFAKPVVAEEKEEEQEEQPEEEDDTGIKGMLVMGDWDSGCCWVQVL